MALFFLLVGVTALGGAFISQYGFDLKPCVLCIYQRYPFGIVIALAALLYGFRDKKVRDGIITLAIITLLVGGGIAVFHVGVEQKWWEGTTHCGSDLNSDSIEALRAKIMGAATVRCDEPQFVFLGLSMAGYNVLYSFGAALFASYYLCTLRDKSHGKKKRKA
ncbi:MAG: disulfide bond formation protein B [Proteobacteria bacterium]|nr:disulfide bond formation protein B [Pseudomonadota bacterium]